jgi:sec-independent protein translocase protein TatA
MLQIDQYVMQLAGLGGMEWIIILAIVVALFFGVKKIPELARSFGKASGEYEKAKIEMRKEIYRVKSGITVDVENNYRQKLESVASRLGLETYKKTDEELRKTIEENLK